jgi:antitoxin component of MazEF toxin-antitoxin module
MSNDHGIDKTKSDEDGWSTLVMTLPKEWVRHHELKPKDKVEILFENGNLLIRPSRPLDPSTAQREKLGQ